MLQIIPSFLYTFKNFPCLFFCDKSNQLGKRKSKYWKAYLQNQKQIKTTLEVSKKIPKL